MCTLFVSTKLPYQSTFRKSVDIWVLLGRGGVVSASDSCQRATPGKSSPEYFSFVTQSQDNLRSPSCLESSITPGDILPDMGRWCDHCVAPGDTCPHTLPGSKLGHGHHEWGGNVSHSASATPGAVSLS